MAGLESETICALIPSSIITVVIKNPINQHMDSTLLKSVWLKANVSGIFTITKYYAGFVLSCYCLSLSSIP